MIDFTQEEKRVLKYYALFMGLALAATIAIAICGCSSMSINKHKKLVILNQDVAEQIAKTAYQMHKDGILSDSDNVKIRDLYNTFRTFNRLYAHAIIEYETHKDDTALMKLNSAQALVNDTYTELVKVATILINWKGGNP